MKISVIIPTKDRQLILQRTINNLIAAIDGLDAEVIIVNDSKQPVTISQPISNFKIINNSKAGAASARNLGVKSSSGELLLFLDDDIIINKANILTTLKLHQEQNKKAFNFFWIYPPDVIEILPQSSIGRYFIKHMLFTNSFRVKINGKMEQMINAGGLTSQYFSILKSDFLLSGGYEDNIPYAGVEDLILYKKLRQHGVEVYLSTGNVIFQNEADRLSVYSIMERTRKGAITIKKAEELGYQMDVNITVTKRMVYGLAHIFKEIIYKLTQAMPNVKYLDFIYFKLVNILLGLSFYQGYFKDSKENKSV